MCGSPVSGGASSRLEVDDAGAQKLDAAGGKIAGLELFVRTLQGPAEVAHAQPPDLGANLRLSDRGGPEEAPEESHEALKAAHLFTPCHASAIQSREGANGTDGAAGGAATDMVDMDCLEARKPEQDRPLAWRHTSESATLR